MKVVHEYASITSVKGIPRLLRAKSPFMQFVWGLSIICFLVIAFCQALMLTMSYLEYSAVASIKEQSLELSGRTEESVHLPDITFCNINPFASNFTDATDIPSLQEFVSQAKEMTRCDGCSWEEEVNLLKLQEELLTTRGYHSQIGSHNAWRISHQQESMIASCDVWVVSGVHPNTIPCEKFVKIKQHHDSMVYNCFTIQSPRTQQRDLFYIGLILVLHIDNYGIDNYPFSLPFYGKLKYMNGFLYAFHPPGSPPVLLKEQWFVQAGLFTDFKIRVQSHKRLSQPYGNCVENAGIGNEYIKNGSYSQLVCFSLCGQAISLKMCGCVDHNYYIDVLSTTHDRACLSMNHGKDKLMELWTCMQKARRVSSFSCMEKCPLPCEELKFETKMTHTSWPSDQLKPFYEEYISNRSYAHHYAGLVDLHNDNDLLKKLELRHQINQHFAGLQMYLDQFTLLEFNDRPQLPFIGFLSQLGGALNLWAGITVVIVIELIELIYESLARRCKRRPSTSRYSDEDNDAEKLEVLVDCPGNKQDNILT